jgi:hypothetical protein
VVSLLHDHLSALHCTVAAENWPHTLYLQVDNCWKENKNTTMLHYLGLLVHYGWFRNNLDFEWQKMESLKCEILKSLVIAKGIHLTQKNILKKKMENFSSKSLYFLIIIS